MYEKINSENVIMFAIRHYNNPQCEGELEFYDDLKRFKYIKRLFKKYVDTKVLKERLLLNHFIVLRNVFGPDASVTLLLYKVDKNYWSALKTILDYLGYLYPHELDNIKVDKNIDELLREL